MHGSNHSHKQIETVPAIQGRTIHWADHYDLVVKLLTLGKENALYKETIRHASKV